MSSPAVIFVNQFVYDWHIGVMDYSDYINRESAQIPLLKPDDSENEGDYYGYMSREAAQEYQLENSKPEYTTIFDAENDFLTKAQLDHYRELEIQSRSEGCPKYIPVMSFDNTFLINNGLMTGGRVDVQRIKDISRKAINALIDNSEKLDAKNTYWTADLHVNTDNIHVHFSLLEYHRLVDRQKVNARDGKDMIELKAFESFKSTVANNIILDKRTPELTKFKRENLIPEFASNVTASKEILDLMKKLPPPKPNVGWQYGRKEIIPFHNDINRCIDKIIASNEKVKEKFVRFKDMLNIMNEQYSAFYGNRIDKTKLTYTENQLNDFYNRAGNSLLKQMHKMYTELNNDSQLVSGKEEKENQLRKASDYERSNDYSNAIALLKAVQDPDNRINLALGRVSLYSNKASEVKEGVLLLEKLSKSDINTINSAANATLGHWYLKKEEVEKAKKYLLFAADKDNSQAQYDLGRLFLKTDPPDKKRSIMWLTRSADNGNTYAQTALGAILLKTTDKERAAYYLTLADSGGNETAHNLIERYKKNNEKAVSEKGKKENDVIRSSKPYKLKRSSKIHSYQAKKTMYSARHQMSLCWSTIRRLLEEYERHIKELQQEFEEMNNIATYGDSYREEYVDFGNDYGNNGYSI